VPLVADLGDLHRVQYLARADVEQVTGGVDLGVVEGGRPGLVALQELGPAGDPDAAQRGRAGHRRHVGDVQHHRGVVDPLLRAQGGREGTVARREQQDPAVGVGHVPDRKRARPAGDVRYRGQVTSGERTCDLGVGGLHVGTSGARVRLALVR
jgi:hypothetical protein